MNTFDTYTAEVEYRSDRIRRGVGRNQRKVALPFGRRTEEATPKHAR